MSHTQSNSTDVTCSITYFTQLTILGQLAETYCTQFCTVDANSGAGDQQAFAAKAFAWLAEPTHLSRAPEWQATYR